MRHILGNTPLGKENLLKLFAEAEQLRRYYYKSIGGRYYLSQFLQGKTIALLFFEPSTRTHDSFFLAARTLGADILSHQDMKQTSAAKGESLEDTIRTITAYPQVSAIVMRHPEKGATLRAANTIERLLTAGRVKRSIPVINAGDGSGWHPTQAYLDIYTLWRHGKLQEDGRMRGAIFGDLGNARVIHSLVLELSVFRPKLYLVGPAYDNIPHCVYSPAAVNGAKLVKVSRLQARMLENVDFCYFVRLQEERLTVKSEEEKKQMRTVYKREYGCSSLIRRWAPADTVFLHPGPIREEMPDSAKWDPRFVYEEQIENGVWLRAALLNMLLNPDSSKVP